jgi:hypothetical protein
MRRFVFSLCVFLVIALVARAELIVRNPLAGFGGEFVPERFNIVSVEVQNVGGKPWEGRISLDDGGHSSGGVPYEQSLFLSPGASRWVQFYPFVSGYQRWKISWVDSGGRGDSLDLVRDDDTVKTGGPATVLFISPDSLRAGQSRLRPFMDHLFPPTVTGTEGLYAVVLDYVPRWDAPRRQAFRDWVYRGGIVHLLQGLDGRHPQFSEELAPLNISGELGVFGAGRIVRHSLTRSSISESNLEESPKLLSDGTGYLTDISSALSRRLSDITKPDIPWGLIYFLTFIYIILIGPVFYVQRKRDYRVMLGAFAFTVALFAWLFTVVGRRGYGERQLIHSVGYAESLGGNRYATTQWHYAFAIDSGRYRFQYPGLGHAYHSLGSSGTVNAAVRTGGDAAMEADIPLFSGRAFVHSGVLLGDDTSVEIMEWEETGDASPARLSKFKLKPNANFPDTAMMCAVHGGRIYEMSFSGGVWHAQPSSQSKLLSDWFSGREIHGYDYQNQYNSGAPGVARFEARLEPLSSLFVGQLTGARSFIRQRIEYPEGPKDSIRLFIYARTPASFAVPVSDFAFGGGYVLYSQILRKPLKKP